MHQQLLVEAPAQSLVDMLLTCDGGQGLNEAHEALLPQDVLPGVGEAGHLHVGGLLHEVECTLS